MLINKKVVIKIDQSHYILSDKYSV